LQGYCSCSGSQSTLAHDEIMSLTSTNSFFEIAAILSLATLLSMVGQKLRQPLIIMFLATGILAGAGGAGHHRQP
jgi:hypothetical protein